VKSTRSTGRIEGSESTRLCRLRRSSGASGREGSNSKPRSKSAFVGASGQLRAADPKRKTRTPSLEKSRASRWRLCRTRGSTGASFRAGTTGVGGLSEDGREAACMTSGRVRHTLPPREVLTSLRSFAGRVCGVCHACLDVRPCCEAPAVHRWRALEALNPPEAPCYPASCTISM
jgi:hypothetical protein